MVPSRGRAFQSIPEPSFAAASWPATKGTEEENSRCVRGRFAAAAHPIAAVIPGTISKGIPEVARHSASSPPRAKTNGWPDFRPRVAAPPPPGAPRGGGADPTAPPPPPRPDDVYLARGGADLLPPAPPLHADRDLLPPVLQKLPDRPGRPGVSPSGRHREREPLAFYDRGRQEGAVVRRIRHVHRNAPPTCLPENRPVHAGIGSGGEGERPTVEGLLPESPLDQADHAALRQLEHRGGRLGSDDGHAGAAPQEGTDLP